MILYIIWSNTICLFFLLQVSGISNAIKEYRGWRANKIEQVKFRRNIRSKYPMFSFVIRFAPTKNLNE